MDYTTLSLADVNTALDELARETEASFGGLTGRQLNWRLDATQWSVAQCFDHLLMANRLMVRAAGEALSNARPRSLWQRLPVVPGVLGRMLIRSQAPGNVRKYTASPKAQPAMSAIAADIIPRFVQHHRETEAWVRALDERDAARAIMTSPFVRVITYSVMDGCRLMVAHDRRHLEQAHRVTRRPEFPIREQAPGTPR